MRRQTDLEQPQLTNPAAEGPGSLSRKELHASKRSVPAFAFAILIAAVRVHMIG